MTDLENLHKDIIPGGYFRTQSCLPLATVAVIVPFRDRQSHLISMLFHLIPKLKRQNIDFNIYIIEQVKDNKEKPGQPKRDH